ncbi:NHL repeat-containing protein [Mucilaginibacter sp.]|uniref:NHL repeat-containing protein n=1 Tax=Mucilaginibacter sp. TaxID=1882438 RepID=UPI0028449C23|nr:NHL repeat-containing protein [Mucilaginibacter sp.]MDR3696852.1 NHL repeat-containing protein [Mucilaginibacter sp.]
MKKNLLFLCAATAFAMACNKNKSISVTTYAGSGAIGGVNGKSTEASFSNLMGLAIDSAGNMYVADSRNNLIRKISAEGIVTTIAGSGNQGSADGKGIAASFFFPAALAVDGQGIVYVADTHNSMIRKITPDGNVTTLAGRPDAETMDHPEAMVRFDNPYGIAIDKDGNVFVSDWDKDQIKKVSPDGKVSVYAGTGERGLKDGPAGTASFYLPEGIALDQKGNLYVADTYNNLIRKISPGGMVSTLAGRIKRGSANGKGAAASFSHPDGIAVDKKGNVYVADVGNNKIRKITPDGMVSDFAGSGKRGADNGVALGATFYRPFGITIDNAGNLYVADYQNNLIRKVGK